MTQLLLRSKFSVKSILVICGLLLVFLLAACGYDSNAIQFVDEHGAPYANGNARVACFTQSGDYIVTYNDVALDDDGFGRLPSNASCAQMLAIVPVLDYPAAAEKIAGATGNERTAPFDNAFTIYATSWLPGESGLSAGELAAGPDAQGTPFFSTVVEVRRDQPLVLFNVVTDLEWPLSWPVEKENHAANEVAQGLETASRLLYAVTQGKMAFGNAVVYADGERWNSADIRVKVDNSYRPSAFIGGIINEEHDFVIAEYPTRAAEVFDGNVLPWGGEAYFKPGAIFLGRNWDGRSAESGTWDLPEGANTMMHEWGHYGLAWGDQYRSIFGPSVYCPCPAVVDGGSCPSGGSPQQSPSVMAYQYTAGQAAQAADIQLGMKALCASTPQNQLYGLPEWDALLLDWANVFNLAALAPDAFVLVDHDTSLAPDSSATDYAHYFFDGSVKVNPQAEVGDPDLTLSDFGIELPETPLAATVGHVYTFSDVAGNGRASYQGLLGEDGAMQLMGIQPTDRILVFLDDYAAGQRHFGVGAMSADKTGVTGDVVETWEASLYLSLSCTGDDNRPFDTMTATIVGSPNHPLQAPHVQLCSPDSAELCTPLQPMKLDGNTAAFTFAAPLNGSILGIERGFNTSELPDYGVIRVVDGNRELFSWYQNEGGGGSAHMTGDTPSVDGPTDIETLAPMASRHNQVLSSPVNSWHAIDSFPARTVSAIVGAPFDLSVMQPDAAGDCTVSSGNGEPLPHLIAVNVYYDDLVVDRLLNQGQARMYRLIAPLSTRLEWESFEIIDDDSQDRITQLLMAAQVFGDDYKPGQGSTQADFVEAFGANLAMRDQFSVAPEPNQSAHERAYHLDNLNWFMSPEPITHDRFFVIAIE